MKAQLQAELKVVAALSPLHTRPFRPGLCEPSQQQQSHLQPVHHPLQMLEGGTALVRTQAPHQPA